MTTAEIGTTLKSTVATAPSRRSLQVRTINGYKRAPAIASAVHTTMRRSAT